MMFFKNINSYVFVGETTLIKWIISKCSTISDAWCDFIIVCKVCDKLTHHAIRHIKGAWKICIRIEKTCKSPHGCKGTQRLYY